MRRALPFLVMVLASQAGVGASAPHPAPAPAFNDAHFHLTNYIQEGITASRFLEILGTTTGRSTLFGIPLQQLWSFRVSGSDAPQYYLEADTPLYYYSFTDATIAMAYRSLTREQQARFDPMITGFNPADMYAADHIRRVLETFPGVFSGIGEFTIHKEFVSSKVAGEVASLTDPALDRLLDFAAEAGLVALIHNDMDVPFSKAQSRPQYDQQDQAPTEGADVAPAYYAQMRALLKRHPQTTLIWAHLGLGRVVRPVKDHAALVEEILRDPAYQHVYFDLSWSEVAKYIVASPATITVVAALINRYPDRFLFGTDVVAPKDQQQYQEVFLQYAPLWRALDPETSEKVRLRNYERLFDRARSRVRAWERAHAH